VVGPGRPERRWNVSGWIETYDPGKVKFYVQPSPDGGLHGFFDDSETVIPFRDMADVERRMAKNIADWREKIEIVEYEAAMSAF